MKFRTSAFLVFLAGALVVAPRSAGADDGRIVFNRDIRPILSDNCFKCHGPDAKTRLGKLRLDTREGALEPRKSKKPAVVPGKSSESVLVQRILSTNPDEIMPPHDSGRKLTPAQMDLLRKWIDQGAEWQGHWSFIKAERPKPPAVRMETWVKNPIDRFVLARLEKEGLKPATSADKTTLIRRVSLDLTGLPPTPAEVDAFLADPSPIAYEKLIDRLLASPRYGEHMARQWLDLARYGDTHGLHFDNERNLWKYRDWVIEAFNANKRFDQFTIEQLAGDLLPNSTIEQKIATGFNRCNVSTSEGGSINDEVLFRYAVDRTETMSTVFMGLTLGCAVCHDHKFDPVTQKEFYRLYAFFNSAADTAMDGNSMSPPPILKIVTPDQTAKLKGFDEQISNLRKKIADSLATTVYTEPVPSKPEAAAPREVIWIDDAAPPGVTLQGTTPWEFVTKPHPVYHGQKSMRRSAQGLSQHFFESAKPGLQLGEGDKLFAYVYLDPKNPPKTIMLQFNDGGWEHRAYWGEDLIPWGAINTGARLKMGPLPKPGEWTRLEVEATKVDLKANTMLQGWAFTQHDGTVYWDKAGIVTRSSGTIDFSLSVIAWEAHDQKQPKSTVPQPIRDLIKLKADKRNDAQKKQILNYFLENVYGKTRPIFDPLHKELTALDKQRKDFDATLPVTMVMADLPSPRDSFVLIRGQYDKRGEKVLPGVPQALPPMPKDAPSNRLGMARWLVDPSHPLTARVAVNRYWQHFFGRGLVKTAEDFGAQGEWPTHPELLDWLTVEFTDSGWDIKHMQKLIVLSAAYQQASEVNPDLLKRDPENVLLARGPRFRLDAEVVRDSALYVSGMLKEQVGGRSVKPYQPSGIWEAIGFNGSNTQNYKRDTGAALYRRGMYTFWKRTAPPPSLMVFDAPSRESCVARRARTNTPLQALALMNDEQYVEASRGLAQRMMTEGGKTPADRLAYGFRLATARKPDEREMQVLSRVYQKQLEHYQSHKDEAQKLLAVGESKRNAALDPIECAALTLAANMILNLDESITKE